MQLHRLAFAALGPFPGEHTIDVAALASSGLFLLEGPTGSGKSTLIDAIVFALYGKVASKDASEERLRSGHAKPEDETFVDLVFETGSGIFRVRRTPAYARPKQRGTGTTLQPATARLWRLTSPDAPEDGELIASRLEEVGGELQRAIGLDRAQFVQTVVLPQGEFASFLRANPEDRRGLLQKVFGTEVYDRVEQRLAAMRAEANRSVQTAHAEVGLATEHFLGASGLAEAAAEAVRSVAAEGAAAEALVAVVTEAADGVEQEAVAARGRAVEATAASERSRQSLDEARRVLGLARRRDALAVERDGLAARAPAHEVDVRRLARARRADRVWPSLRGADQADAAAVTAAQTVDRVRTTALAIAATLADMVDEGTEAGVRLKTLGVERDGCTARRSRLTRSLELEAGLAVRRDRFTRMSAVLEERRAERDGAALVVAARPTVRAELVQRRDAAAVLAETRGTRVVEVAAAVRRLSAAQDVARLTTDVAAATEAMALAVADAQAATSRLAEVQRARIAGIAAELAVSLTVGDPCPVCGGTEHPRPAAAGPEQVTAATVTAAEDGRSAAEARLSGAAAVLTDLRARLAAAQHGAEGLDTVAAQQAVASARTAAGEAETAALERDALAGRLASFDQETDRLTAARTSLDVAIATTVAEVGALGDLLAVDEAEVAAARGDAPSVADHAATLDARIAAVSAWMSALGDLVQAEDRRAERAAELDAALTEHGFDGVEGVRAAALAAGALAELDARTRAYESAVAAVVAGLDDPDLAALGADVSAAGAGADVLASEAAHAATTAEMRDAAGAAARLVDRAAASTAAAAEVGRAVADLSEVRRRAVPVIRMANLAAAAGGDNAQQLTLGTYVLVRRFEDVVAAANTRLLVMSGGRYELARSDEREAVRALKRGLAMKVLDHEIETERDPRTLSGGETFYVSLCLALGLADVVTAEAGGLDLGTLFIDEGFGALDAETLDVVLAELGRLRAGGRVVGVVSHVEALKQAIAERVEVRRRPDGASTLTVRA